MNVDETAEVEGDEEEQVSIISYPNFRVQLTKANGSVLKCDCSFDQDSYHEDEDHEVAEEEEYGEASMFKIDHVTVGEEGSYEAETVNMDNHLYEGIMGMLGERGADNQFAQELLDYSTQVEH